MPIVTYLLRIAEARLPTDLPGEKEFGSQKKSQDWFSNMFFETNSAATTKTKLNEAFVSNADSSIPSRSS